MRIHEWSFAYTVRLTDEHRRALARQLGKQGLASAKDFDRALREHFQEWVDIINKEAARKVPPVPRPRTKRVRRAPGATA